MQKYEKLEKIGEGLSQNDFNAFIALINVERTNEFLLYCSNTFIQ